MAYVVTWKRKSNGEVLLETEFDDLRDALEDATLYMPGKFQIEITVTDSDGTEYHRSDTPLEGDT